MANPKKDEFKKIISEGMFNVMVNELGFTNLKNLNDVNNQPPKAKGTAFLKFYLNEIFKDYYRVDEDQIEQGIIDNAYDKGIDFIAIDENKIYIIQSKYNSMNTKEIDHFTLLPENIKQNTYNKTANAELKRYIQEIKAIKNPEFTLIYVTNENVSEEEETYYEEKAKNKNLQLFITDFSKLRMEYESVKTMGENPPETITFKLGNEDYFPLETIESHPTVIITQKGSKLRSLYLNKSCMERLFNYNIRQWLGKNAVNRGMFDTIENEPDKFFYYNNGITAICEDFYYNNETNELVCNKFQVVNGAQTLTTLAKQSDNTDISKVKVLIRIVKADKYTTGDKESSLAANIVKNNNSQTVIKSIDFRSNDNIQVSIENKVKNEKLKYPLDYPITKLVAYKRKRRLNESKVKTISMENVAKTYYSMFKNPCEVCLSSKRLWDISDTGLYYQIFGFNGEKTDFINDEEFYKLFASNYIYAYIDSNIKEELKTIDKSDYLPYYFKYHILWGINKLLHIKYQENEINRIFKRMVNKGTYLNPNVSASKEKDFYAYFDKVIRKITAQVKTEKLDNENIAFRTLILSKSFLNKFELRLEEITENELPILIDTTNCNK